MAQRISNPAIHHIDKDTGAPLSGGQLFFFEINSTTPKDTFSDEEGTVPNSNPVILDASGVEPDIFGVGSFRVVLQNSNDVQQWERDPVNFETSGAQYSDWLATIDYGVNDIVEASDGNFYSSFQTPNLNQDPTISPGFWSRTDLLKRWNTNETYSLGDPVTALDSSLYISQGNNNVGNDPTTDTGANWSNSGQMKLLDVQVANVSSTIEFTTGIDSTFVKYVIELVSVSFSEAAILQLRSSSDGGSSFDSGATDYSWWRQENDSAIVGATFVQDISDSFIQLASLPGAFDTLNGEVVLFDPSASNLSTRFRWDTVGGLINTTEQTLGNAGRILSFVPVNAVQFSMSVGTITSGTFKLYGLL